MNRATGLLDQGVETRSPVRIVKKPNRFPTDLTRSGYIHRTKKNQHDGYSIIFEIDQFENVPIVVMNDFVNFAPEVSSVNIHCCW